MMRITSHLSAGPRTHAKLQCAHPAPVKRRDYRLHVHASIDQTSPSSSDAPKAGKKRFQSSWDAIEAGGGRGGGADYLYEIGQRAHYNTNVDTGQNVAMIDYLFTGNTLGHKTDIADGSLRGYEFRTLNHLVGDYAVAPRFIERVTADMGCFDKHMKVALILGIWGPKGCGKSFQTELVFKKLGCEPVIMSAGELEHEWAGTPGRLIRERYRRASEMSRVRGKFSCLMINDIDAGLGHFTNTQVTVNNQICIGTLMNICDMPNQVSIGQEWREGDYVRRTPIIVTGNDFTRMFAPLIRDGRMEKFYWQPEKEELVAILHQMYRDDGLSTEDMVTLLERFCHQSLDFFGAIRAATYDNQIRNWIRNDILGADITSEGAKLGDLGKALLKKTLHPKFEPVQLTIDMLIKEGERLEYEQEMVNQHKLSVEYYKKVKTKWGGGGSLIGLKG